MVPPHLDLAFRRHDRMVHRLVEITHDRQDLWDTLLVLVVLRRLSEDSLQEQVIS